MEARAGTRQLVRGVSLPSNSNLLTKKLELEEMEVSDFLFCRTVSFLVLFVNETQREGCNTITSFNEGVEFGIRLAEEEEWIPLAVIYRNNGPPADNITLGNMPNLIIRDYFVSPQNTIESSVSDPIVNFSLTLCEFRDPSFFQFRWLQTSRLRPRLQLLDLWSLDEVHISYTREDGEEEVLLSDSFDQEELK